MPTVWLVTGNCCGDYYCEGEHVLAVASTEADADALRASAESATWANRFGQSGPRWTDVTVERVEVDVLRDEAKSISYAR